MAALHRMMALLTRGIDMNLERFAEKMHPAALEARSLERHVLEHPANRNHFRRQ